MNGKRLRIGSRESPLALVQSKLVMSHLKRHHPALELELHTFKTTGDRFLDAPLAQVGDKGLFVKELEEALLAGQIDLAVHSLKDMLSVLPNGLAMQSVLEREDPRDVLIVRSDKRQASKQEQTASPFEQLPAGAIVGTASLRRVAQLRRLRPDLRYELIRGNLQTRLRKMGEGQYDALVLAAAGVHRMGWQDKITQYFEVPTQTLPAVGQGILAVEFRADDQQTQQALIPLLHAPTEIAMQAERAFLRTLEGGCRLPIGAYAHTADTAHYHLHGVVLSPDGSQIYEADRLFSPEQAEQSGIDLAQQLLSQGASQLLREISHQA